MTRRILLYDTTLRDGTQGEKISFSAEDKIRVARKLDELGFDYIEGGWPGSNPKDARFFEMARQESFRHARLTAFGSTCRPGLRPDEDLNIQSLLASRTSTVAVFGKSWDLHVTEVMAIDLDENLRMIRDSVAFLRARGREVIYDAEHFFDGFKRNPQYALNTLLAAQETGAGRLVLCDTNGGVLPGELLTIISEIRPLIETPLGIHVHNDGGLAVANTLAAVSQGGVTLVQGTINGYGERCGNADLTAVIGNLQLKMGYTCLAQEKLAHLTELSRYVSEVANVPPANDRPFVGKSAFAHKGGVHVNAVMKNPAAYEHVDPELAGNRRRVLISDLSGKSNIHYKAQELGLVLEQNGVDPRSIVEKIKSLEDEGYQFDAAEGSFELLVKKATGQFREPFALELLRLNIEKNRDGPASAHATIKISVGREVEITAAEGHGPVNALDNALRKALYKFFPELREVHLVDYKVRVIEGSDGTAARVKVLIESRDTQHIWSTMGVSENIIEASWLALVDSLQYKLCRGTVEPGEANLHGPGLARVSAESTPQDPGDRGRNGMGGRRSS